MDINPKRVRADAFDTMWGFLMMVGQKSDIPALKEHCESLRNAMLQKTAGQRANKPKDIDFDDVHTLCNCIVIEAMALYLSGDLDKLEGVP